MALHPINKLDEIIAIDPGKTTGYVHLQVDMGADKYPFTPIIMREIEWDEHWGFMSEVHDVLYHNKGKRIIIVVENFLLYAHEAVHQINSDFPSSQIIGVCKYIAAMTTTELVLQMASVKRQFSGKDIDKWFKPDVQLPTSLHIRDAISHALYLYFDRRLK